MFCGVGIPEHKQLCVDVMPAQHGGVTNPFSNCQNYTGPTGYLNSEAGSSSESNHLEQQEGVETGCWEGWDEETLAEEGLDPGQNHVPLMEPELEAMRRAYQFKQRSAWSPRSLSCPGEAHQQDQYRRREIEGYAVRSAAQYGKHSLPGIRPVLSHGGYSSAMQPMQTSSDMEFPEAPIPALPFIPGPNSHDMGCSGRAPQPMYLDSAHARMHMHGGAMFDMQSMPALPRVAKRSMMQPEALQPQQAMGDNVLASPPRTEAPFMMSMGCGGNGCAPMMFNSTLEELARESGLVAAPDTGSCKKACRQQAPQQQDEAMQGYELGYGTACAGTAEVAAGQQCMQQYCQCQRHPCQYQPQLDATKPQLSDYPSWIGGPLF